MSADPRVFVSYSRQDGQAAAADLRARLAAEGLSLWQDLVAMEGGHDWRRQIEEAITRAEHVVLVLTPPASRSRSCWPNGAC
ncbi:MAG TPA: toll/interleukin-1 receptor domain-containing protein [Geminicoccaceae bacterium]|nr:toll/interleukin-1 receptor domain-containing protein [Geminicoccaceae bacterium]